ncbi:MAG: hypothetical protein GX661_02220 [Acholeplasmataceae bacterium]|nr:hypothetical protein [Acholeplasmataceae bacterium]
MKIRTISQLSDFLSAELSWRRKELTILKGQVENNSLANNANLVFLRGGVALLYAHFEGYIKKASTAYLEFVRMQRLLYKDLSNHFFSIALKQKFLTQYSSKAYSDFMVVAEFVRSNMATSSDFNHRNVIDTESNLSSIIFKEIVLSLGLDYATFEGLEKLIDTKLLQKRNHIAHGEFTDIDIEDYRILHERIIAVLDNFRTQIENSAVLMSYKKE